MKVKFNKYERTAGIFVLFSIVAGFVFLISAAIKQSWFEPRIHYVSIFESADGVHEGTVVEMAGLKAGNVESVELLKHNKILVKFYVYQRFQDKIRKDSVAQFIRPYVIGERTLDISVGSEDQVVLADNGEILTRESMDIVSILSGKNLGNYLSSMGTMLLNLKSLAEALLDKNHTEAMIRIIDRMDPLVKNLNTMSLEMIKLSKQATKDDHLEVVIGQLATTTKELNAMLPGMAEKAPEMTKDLESIVKNMAILTEQFKVFVPALAEVAPQLPHASKRAVEALDEAVVLMKAMQKTFLIRSAAQEVREEENKDSKKQRKPANSGE